LNDFFKWAKEQPWYTNTVISVMGDHSMPMLSAKAGIPASDSLYWTNFIINSAVTTPVRARAYSSLDMFPTLLESMGFALDCRSAGLGRSLYSDSLTMLELYGRQILDSLLRERSIQYDAFLMKK
jgi:phosphoglycerol transferase